MGGTTLMGSPLALVGARNAYQAGLLEQNRGTATQ